LNQYFLLRFQWSRKNTECSVRKNIPGQNCGKSRISHDSPVGEQEAQGHFRSRGAKGQASCLESRFYCVSMVLPEKWLKKYRRCSKAPGGNSPVYPRENTLLETLVGIRRFKGVPIDRQDPPPASSTTSWPKFKPSSPKAMTRSASFARGPLRLSRGKSWRAHAQKFCVVLTC